MVEINTCGSKGDTTPEAKCQPHLKGCRRPDPYTHQTTRSHGPKAKYYSWVYCSTTGNKGILASWLAYKKWVNDRVKEMEDANASRETPASNNTRQVFSIVNQLSKKPKPPPRNIKSDANGKILESAKEAAELWLKFLSEKFSTNMERTRRKVHIPCYRSPDSRLKYKEFEISIKRMADGQRQGRRTRQNSRGGD